MLKALFVRFRSPINIKRGPYTVDMLSTKDAEIELCGVMVNKYPCDRETGEQLEDDHIILDELSRDLLPESIRTTHRDNNTFDKNQQETLKEAGEANECVEKTNENKCSSKQTVNATVLAERKRLSELDEIAPLYGPVTVYEAKYGKNKCTAQELAYATAKRSMHRGMHFLNAIKEDYEAGAAANVAVTIIEPDYPRELTAEEKMVQGQFYARQAQKKNK